MGATFSSNNANSSNNSGRSNGNTQAAATNNNRVAANRPSANRTNGVPPAMRRIAEARANDMAEARLRHTRLPSFDDSRRPHMSPFMSGRDPVDAARQQYAFARDARHFESKYGPCFDCNSRAFCDARVRRKVGGQVCSLYGCTSPITQVQVCHVDQCSPHDPLRSQRDAYDDESRRLAHQMSMQRRHSQEYSPAQPMSHVGGARAFAYGAQARDWRNNVGAPGFSAPQDLQSRRVHAMQRTMADAAMGGNVGATSGE